MNVKFMTRKTTFLTFSPLLFYDIVLYIERRRKLCIGNKMREKEGNRRRRERKGNRRREKLGMEKSKIGKWEKQ